MFLTIYFSLQGQEKSDSTFTLTPKEKQIKGWSFGAIPAIAFDSDIGFKYGAVLNLFDYGNGSIYPNYRHSIYLEWSRTTKGSGINQISYDSKYLIKGIRFTGDVSYFQEQALDFYGFNGYEATYNHNFEDLVFLLKYPNYKCIKHAQYYYHPKMSLFCIIYNLFVLLSNYLD